MEKLFKHFFEAAAFVLEKELKVELKQESPIKEGGNFVTDDVAVIVGVLGDCKGQLFLEMSSDTAKNVAQKMLNDVSFEKLDVILSGIAELGNVVSGKACSLLEAYGTSVKIAPPTVMFGKNVVVSTLETARYKVTYSSSLGDFIIRVGLKCGE